MPKKSVAWPIKKNFLSKKMGSKPEKQELTNIFTRIWTSEIIGRP